MNANTLYASRYIFLSALLSIVLLIFLSTCGASEPGQASNSVDVSLLENGAEPRKKFRIAPTAGSRETMVMRMKTDMKMEMDGRVMPTPSMPAIIMNVRVNISNVEDNGDIRYSFSFGKSEVEAGSNAMKPGMLEMMKESLDSLSTVTAKGVTTSRGLSLIMRFDGTENLPAAARQPLQSIKSSFQNMTGTFPSEAIGVGARWVVRSSMTMSGMRVRQESSYELLSIDGSTLRLKVAVLHGAEPQEVVNPDMSPDAKVCLLEMSGKGSGTMEVHLGHFVPSKSEFDMTSKVNMQVTQAGQTQDMLMDMDLKLTISRN